MRSAVTFPNDTGLSALKPYHAELQKKKDLFLLPAVEGATAHVAEGKHAGDYVIVGGRWTLSSKPSAGE